MLQRAPSPGRSAALVLAALVAACGDGAPRGGGAPAGAQPIPGLTAGAWSWVPVDGARCEDGTPTGVAVSPGAGPDLVVFLNGGGACWDWLSCYVLDLAATGPFGEAEFRALGTSRLPGSILDRTLPGNPYADASLVFVPYCTGDVHAGVRVATYTGAEGARAYHHVGRLNLEAALPRLAATFPSPRRLVVAGSSAGGFGSLLNYDLLRSTWPHALGLLVDDSGPPLPDGAVPPAVLSAWRASWGVDTFLAPLCGSACDAGFGPLVGKLSARWPGDRFALLSSVRDTVVSGYFQLAPSEFEAALRAAVADDLGPVPGAAAFLVPGDGHTMLGAPAKFTQGVPLLDWLSAQARGDAGWASEVP
ncbi:MAG: pectin acetylesterase-family hydrolase [Anaeromyxobacter sp.]